jgi:hypothetical protein
VTRNRRNSEARREKNIFEKSIGGKVSVDKVSSEIAYRPDEGYPKSTVRSDCATTKLRKQRKRRERGRCVCLPLFSGGMRYYAETLRPEAPAEVEELEVEEEPPRANC